jgi:uncharacterized repeat protein (TIGR03803 family)
MKTTILRSHHTLGTPRSFTTVSAQAANACREPSGPKLRACGSPWLPCALAVALAGLGLPVIPARGADFERIHSFGDADKFGITPYSEVIEGTNATGEPDGWLYGTTLTGGKSIDHGTVFRLKKDGTKYEVLQHFYEPARRPNEGVNPRAGLVQGRSDPQWLYGTTYGGGGPFSGGTVFRLNKDPDYAGPDRYKVLHGFGSGDVNGCYPMAGLVEDDHGNLYGTASAGGSGNAGTVFKLKNDGNGFTKLWRFKGEGIPDDGSTPEGTLVLAADGWLYGTTSAGGSAGYGTVFKVVTSGDSPQVLYHFGASSTAGRYPKAGLRLGSDDYLYGTTEQGGSGGYGIAFKQLRWGDASELLHAFSFSEGAWPVSRLVQGRGADEEWLYGTTAGGGPVTGYGTVFRLTNSNKGLMILTNFTGLNGANPRAGVVVGSDGYLYGTTSEGGTANQGTVFKLRRDGTDFQLIWSFKTEGGDGANAHAPFVTDRDGWLYGVTEAGGKYGYGNLRLGTVFKMLHDGSSYQVIHSFGGPAVQVRGPNGSDALGPDGYAPKAGLLIASDGRLYGVTSTDSQLGSGTVFTLRKDGSDYRVLWRFRATDYSHDGFGPYGKLVEDRDGWLYGTTHNGGGGQNYGTVYKLRKDGTGYRTIKRFPNTPGPNADGASPRVGLVIDQDWLYGTTYYGGKYDGGVSYGTVFKLNRHGTNYGDEVLWRFRDADHPLDGQHPSELILDHSGEGLYGTTPSGGSAAYGTVFRLRKDGSGYDVVWNFGVALPDAAVPQVGLVEGADGTFYGTTQYGPYVQGMVSSGAIFKLRATESEFDCAVLRYFYLDTMGQLYAPLVRGPDCRFYASSVQGGEMAWGTVYRFDPTPGDYPPRAVADTFDTQVNAALVIEVGALAENDSYDGTPVIELSDDPLTQGTVNPAAVGRFLYEPKLHYVGWDRFKYLLKTGTAQSEGIVNVLVRPKKVWVKDTYTTDNYPGRLIEIGDQQLQLGVDAFNTIEDAVYGVADSGTVVIHSGTYNEGVTLLYGKWVVIEIGESPGQVTINGSLTLSTNSTLEIELAGPTPGTGFDQLVVTNAANLAGTVELKLTEGFYPARDATFNFLSAGTSSGSFDQFLYPSNDVGAALSFTPTGVVAQVVNVRPEMPAIATRFADESALFSLMVNATDADLPPQTLTYALTNSPAGAAVSATGEITWAPTEAQGPMTTNITVCVTDSGTPNLTVSRTFQVAVNEVNVAPALTLPPNQAFDEQTAFSANATATDSDLPANALEFALVSGPDGLTVSPTGAIAWTPTETQGSNTYTISIRVTDTNPGAVNNEHLSTTNRFELTVSEVNRPPTLGGLTDHHLDPGQTLSFAATATDPDRPANTLLFSLLNPPAGATIDPSSGQFNWRPAVALANTTNTIQVRVEDDGRPVQSDRNTFLAIVNPLSAPVTLTPISRSDREFAFTVTGPIGPDYVVQASGDLTTWTNLHTNTPAAVPFAFPDIDATTFDWRFYRVTLSP